ncbi:hypothetical protein KAU19_06580 [Candidatus Parcubacteria bacterium]|nr:hypothetical protein [Candidatus Parcubacteria bacterium]
MFKKITIFIILISTLILTSCSITKPADDKKNKSAGQDNNQQADKPIDMGLLTKAYQMEVKVILNNYLRQTQDESLLTINDVSRTKNSFLALKMPSKYKGLHLNLVLAMDKMEDYLLDGDEGKRLDSERLIKQAKEEYAWLN